MCWYFYSFIHLDKTHNIFLRKHQLVKWHICTNFSRRLLVSKVTASGLATSLGVHSTPNENNEDNKILQTFDRQIEVKRLPILSYQMF